MTHEGSITAEMCTVRPPLLADWRLLACLVGNLDDEPLSLPLLA